MGGQRIVNHLVGSLVNWPNIYRPGRNETIPSSVQPSTIGTLIESHTPKPKEIARIQMNQEAPYRMKKRIDVPRPKSNDSCGIS
jgi:hypothetical protein